MLTAIVGGLVGGITGAFSAFVFNFIHWKIVEKNKSLSSLCKLSTSFITELENHCLNYWLSENNREQKRLELEIVSMCSVVRSLVIELNAKSGAKKARSELQSLENFTIQIFDTATGGSFESSNRSVDNARAAKISKLCTNAKMIILRLAH